MAVLVRGYSNTTPALIQTPQCELNNIEAKVKKYKTIASNINWLYDSFKSYTAKEFKIQDLSLKREDFEKKYGDNPWIKTAVVVFALVGIGLSIYGAVSVYSASQAWINAPRAPGEIYSNFETVCFWTVMTFGLGGAVFLAIPGVPIALLLCTAIKLILVAFSPKNTIMAFAPNPESEIQFNERKKRCIMKLLGIDEDQFHQLKVKIGEILSAENKNEEEKKENVIDYLREQIPSFGTAVKEMEDFIRLSNAQQRQDNDDE